MELELQIQSTVLVTLLRRAVQKGLSTACFGPIGPAYVDHADVSSDPVPITAVGNTLQLSVPVDVSIVQRSAVLAAPNGVPVGATTPMARLIIDFALATAGNAISLSCAGTRLDPPNPLVDPRLLSSVCGLMSSVGGLDLTSIFAAFGLPGFATSTVELVGTTVAIRFNPTGNAENHLFPIQEWGLFIDGPTIVQLAEARVRKDLGTRVQSVSVNGSWAPDGTTPKVNLGFTANIPLPDPFPAGDLDGTTSSTFALTPPGLHGLRTTVNWGIHVDLGMLVPSAIDNLVEDTIANAMNQPSAGKTIINDRSFMTDVNLPDVAFGGSRCRYASILASPAGMTIGGPVQLMSDPGTKVVQVSSTPFGVPWRLQLCSVLAKSGSGDPTRTVFPNEVSTTATIVLSDMAMLCSTEIISPGNWLAPYIFPSDETVTITIPSLNALPITDPVQIVFVTSRGVRLVELAPPPPVEIVDGQVTNANLMYIDDCLYIPVDDNQEGIDWGRGIDPVIDLTGHPDWLSYLSEQPGLDVQLVTLTGLAAGERVLFRSRDHAIDITADDTGRALVPVLIPITDRGDRSTLVTETGRPLGDLATVQSTVFMRRATLPSQGDTRLEAMNDGRMVLRSAIGNRQEAHELASFGVPLRVQLSESEGTLQALDGSQPARPRIDLPGLATLDAIPGFEREPVAIATMDDGRKLVIDLSQADSPRVAGTFAGPFGRLTTAQDWGFAPGHDGVIVYKAEPDRPNARNVARPRNSVRS